MELCSRDKGTITSTVNATTPTKSLNIHFPSSPSPTSSSSPPHHSTNTVAHAITPPAGNHVILSPCAACKILRRRCAEKCVLAPYFPPTDPLKFSIAHRVYGASNIIKLLQELPESQRADAVSSMVYEANARLRDPVYGSTGAIFQLQKQISELQGELAQAQAEIAHLQCYQDNLLAIICMQKFDTNHSPEPVEQNSTGSFLNFYSDMNCSLSSVWEKEPLGA